MLCAESNRAAPKLGCSHSLSPLTHLITARWACTIIRTEGDSYADPALIRCLRSEQHEACQERGQSEPLDN